MYIVLYVTNNTTFVVQLKNKEDMKTVYEKSNSIETVALSRFSKSEYNNFLSSNESIRNREKAAQKLCDYLCDKFRMPHALVTVTNRCQPHKTNYSGSLSRKTLGTYTVGAQTITLYNLTAIKKQPVSIKVMAETLLHEFMHHYDMTYLKLGNSLHTAGFYKRISDLMNKLK